jgi:hypothetical protein
MHFCPNEYRLMSGKLGLRHLRWQNRRSEDNRPNHDTRVPPGEFVELLGRAAALVRGEIIRAQTV